MADHIDPPFQTDELRQYFDHSANSQKWLAKVAGSLDNANEFLRTHGWESLDASRTSRLPAGVETALQYYKDETFLTLYGFAALHQCAGESFAARLNRLLERAFPRGAPNLDTPTCRLEQQIPAPKGYQNWLRGPQAPSHPVRYIRDQIRETQALEGATHVDALIADRDKTILIEAKFLSDISHDTKYSADRNQIARNLDAGLEYVNGRTESLYFLLLTPRCFKQGPPSRLYRYKMEEYSENPGAVARDLAHRASAVDAATLSRQIGWFTWEDLCEVLAESRDADPRVSRVLDFFRERQLAGAAA